MKTHHQKINTCIINICTTWLLPLLLALPATLRADSALSTIATNGAVMNFAFCGSNYLVGIETPRTNYALLTSSNGIAAQLLSTNGDKIGSLITVARSGISTCTAFDGTNYLLIWEDDGFGASYHTGGFQIYGQFISKAGAAVGSPFAISSANVWFDGIHVMAYGGGKYLVTYTELIDVSLGGQSDNRFIAGKMVSPNGMLGGEFRISTGYGDASEVAFDGTNFFAVWCEDYFDTEIRGRFISPVGVPGTEISVNASTAPSDNPKAVAFDGTNYLVVWDDEVDTTNGYWNVLGQLVSPAGALVGGVIPVSTNLVPQLPTSVAFDGRRYLVSLVDMSNGANWDCYGQFLNRSGSLFGDKFAISTDPQNQMCGVGYANGKYLIAVNTGVVMGEDGISQVSAALGYFLTPPSDPQVLTTDAHFGIRTNQFGFTITGYTNVIFVVDASTNLASPVWQPVQTNTLTGGSVYFSDPQWTKYPGRFYRLRLP
jgi:hypothetical protein